MTKSDEKIMIGSVCEAYSEHYATYDRESMVNILCELYPSFYASTTATVRIIRGIREQLSKVYNIKYNAKIRKNLDHNSNCFVSWCGVRILRIST